MKYPHIVVKNGVWYPAGTDVPEESTPKAEIRENNVEVKKLDFIAEISEVDPAELVDENDISEEVEEMPEETEKNKRGRKPKEEKV